jgi:hypothetical protein
MSHDVYFASFSAAMQKNSCLALFGRFQKMKNQLDGDSVRVC